MISKYMNAVYKDGARGEIIDGVRYFDCWGMTRSARVELYGRKLMGAYAGEYRYDPDGFNCHYMNAVAREAVEIEEPVPGAVVAVVRRRSGLCGHVGLVVHDIYRTGQGLHVLEINPNQNARILPLYRFREANQLRALKFYDDPCLSEQA